MGILEVVNNAKDFSLSAFNSAVLTIVGALSHLTVDRGLLPVDEPHVRAAYTILQGLMMGGKAGIFLYNGKKHSDQRALLPEEMIGQPRECGDGLLEGGVVSLA